MATDTKPRGPIDAEFNSPGPAYVLPKLTGAKEHDPRSTKFRAPAYSFGVRHSGYTSDSSPGPCYHPDPKLNNRGRSGSPHYSLYGRTKESSSLDNFPGPGEYDVSKSMLHVYPTGPRAPIGLRHDQRSSDQTPAPNTYALPTTLGKSAFSDKRSAPSVGLKGRLNQGSFSEDLHKTPGPCAYNVVDSEKYKTANPKYSLGARHSLPTDANVRPGPDAYSPEKQFKNAKKRNPAFSFGIRHSQYSGTMITEADVS